MQVYLIKDGVPNGPFPIEELRRSLEAGHCLETDYACHDGTNWVTVATVLDVEREVQQLNVVKVQKTKLRNKIYAIVGIVSILALAVSCIWYFAGGSSIVTKTSASQVATNGDIFTFTPENVVSIYDGDTFKIDLAGVHPLFGDDVSIRLFGVDTPEIRGSEDHVKVLAKKARDLTEKALLGAEKIELKNPQRGKYFRIIADVYVDGKSLAELLMKAELAKSYDGEGAKPVW
jgi:micrococcal nuclease